ncbi:hypothetical protein X925_04680 [Petrotoga sp. 9T1HF07.CasAA.8.2]|nr:hypothetical protein X925_04680 [Petrotoga sp. 9T1HF07.CasAA.8.2]
MVEKWGKGPQVPLPHGWGAGEGRYKIHYTRVI